jgi:predicted site-specific integrase-resolvase
MTPVTEERLLKTRDVADRLGIHFNTMARYIKAGAFGEILVLSQTDRRIRQSALEHFITQRLAR